ncbi:MAG: hypothetical protein IRY85_03105 [Micromonosporaceae bacterium]|nr:hypothetical protein [Micromonosporaceae bacterium]
MRKHHMVAVSAAAVLTLAVLVDAVVIGVTGQNTFVTDDEAGPMAAAIAFTIFQALTYASLCWVLVAEAGQFAGANKAARITRRTLLAGFALLTFGTLVLNPLLRLLSIEEGPLYDVSGLLALLALVLTYGSALVLGLALLRTNPLGIGGRVLALIGPAIALIVVVGMVAPAWASPVWATITAVVGTALLGVKAVPARRPEPAVTSA